MNHPPYVLVTVSGPDHPGITSNLMEIMSKSEDQLIDIGQAVTHGLLSLSILIQIKNPGTGEPDILKDLLFQVNKMGLNFNYNYIETLQDLHPEETEKFILNCVSVENITSAFLRDVAQFLASNNINIQRIDNVSPATMKSMEIMTQVPKGVNYKTVKSGLLKISTDHYVDVAFLKDNVFRRSKRLIVFDMDSTLIQTEVIDEMAEVCGVRNKVSAITEKAMNGEINFDQSLKERVAQLKGLEVSKLKEILEILPFTPGAEEFIKTVKGLGYKVALISGGFSFFANALKEKLGLDYAFANELEIEDGRLTGNIEGTIINADQKALLLKVIAQQENINLEQVVAIGDGANDLPMLSSAGLGIAYHAKDIVKKEAEQHMSHGPMTSILYFLGIPGPGSLK